MIKDLRNFPENVKPIPNPWRVRYCLSSLPHTYSATDKTETRPIKVSFQCAQRRTMKDGRTCEGCSWGMPDRQLELGAEWMGSGLANQAPAYMRLVESWRWWRCKALLMLDMSVLHLLNQIYSSSHQFFIFKALRIFCFFLSKYLFKYNLFILELDYVIHS